MADTLKPQEQQQPTCGCRPEVMTISAQMNGLPIALLDVKFYAFDIETRKNILVGLQAIVGKAIQDAMAAEQQQPAQPTEEEVEDAQS